MLHVEVFSTETIKPSSPTPENLRWLQLSLIDQLVFPPLHIPFILFYSSDGTTEKSSRLKKSLSDVLTRFYPLAGRIKHGDDGCGYSSVECNDEGVDFYEARIDSLLTKFLRQPIEESNQLLPRVVSTDVPLTVQFNVFKCGGSAVGILLSHVVADGSSLIMFVNSWAAATRGDLQKVVSPTFGFAALFPPRRMMKQQMAEESTAKEKVTLKRFLFEASKIEIMKEKVFARAGFSPTRVEVLYGLIWRCSMRARRKVGHQRKPVAMQQMDIRGRMEPPLPESSFGNLAIRVFTTVELLIDDCDIYRVGYLEGKFRDSIGKIKADNIRESLEGDGGMDVSETMWSVLGEEWEKYGFDFSMFSSLCRFPVYECDFGWGKPEWMSSLSVPTKNGVILVPTRSGEGIEAWVLLVEEEMAKFEQDPELLAYVSVPPFGILSRY